MLGSNCALVGISVLRFVIPYASTKVNSYAMCLMLVYDHFRFLIGRFSIYLLAFICTKQEYYVCIQLLKPKLCQMSPPYLPICGISMAFEVNLFVPTLIFKMNFLFVCQCFLKKRQGVANVFHARHVILKISVYSLVIAREYDKGISDAQSQNEK